MVRKKGGWRGSDEAECMEEFADTKKIDDDFRVNTHLLSLVNLRIRNLH